MLARLLARLGLGDILEHGHPDFADVLIELAELHDRKSEGYATGGPPLGNFERRAVIAGLYPGLDLSDPTVVAVWDMFKQLDAYLWMACQGYEAIDEPREARLADIASYGIIAMILEGEG